MKYVNVEELLKAQFRAEEYNQTTGDWDLPVVAVADIEAMPAADVALVRHARWFTRTYYRESTHAYDCVMRVCSACETEWSYDAETGVSDFYYCPHCGAKMDMETP